MPTLFQRRAMQERAERRSLGMPAFATLTVLVAVAAALFLTACSPAGAQGGHGQPGGPAPVSVLTLQPQRVELSTELAGRTVAYQTAEVRPQVNGIVKTHAAGELVRLAYPFYLGR